MDKIEISASGAWSGDLPENTIIDFQIEGVFRAHCSNLQRIRQFLRRACKTGIKYHKDPDLVDKLELVVNEIACSIIQSGIIHDNNIEPAIHLNIKISAGCIIFEFGYAGNPLYHQAPNCPESTDYKSQNCSLYVVDELTDKVCYWSDDNQCKVYLMKQFEA